MTSIKNSPSIHDYVAARRVLSHGTHAAMKEMLALPGMDKARMLDILTAASTEVIALLHKHATMAGLPDDSAAMLVAVGAEMGWAIMAANISDHTAALVRELASSPASTCENA